MVKAALGRGLGALLGGSPPGTKPASPFVPAPAPTATAALSPVTESAVAQINRLPLSRIRPCPFQPRKDFTAESIRELADSIKEKGLLQPLLVRPQGDHFELIAGERRWRAAQLLELAEVPVNVRAASDREVLEMALVENLQRENLNPIEEAQGFAQLISQFQLKQEEAAAKVGKNRASVANALRLLKLSGEIQAYLRDGHLSVGHAKVILALAEPDLQRLAAERVLKDGLNVRQLEEMVAHMQSSGAPAAAGAGKKSTIAAVRDAHVVDLENRLQQRLGTRVGLHYRKGKGSLEIRFYSDDELERILAVLGLPQD